MPRTAALNPKTREKLLDAATSLMLSQGYNGTSVDAICAEAGVTKGSFFHYFESKDELGRAALQRFCTKMEWKFELAIGLDKDPWKRVLGYLDAVEQIAKDPEASRGCLLGGFAAEMCDCNSAIRSQCCSGFRSWTEKFGEVLAAAKKSVAPRAAWDPHEVAEHFIAVLEGSLLLTKAQRDPAVVARNVRHFRAYLKGLCGK
ncbi:MAG: TetR family transcriptional [Planctomycetota bacterium]|nr:MAG: TetR family transcriptional [Planctomycetota bacterium]